MAGDPLIGTKLGDYDIRRVLGQGGMARVYLGHDTVLQRDAAVKVVDPHFVRDDERDEYRERFLREARAIARLHHPNIVGVYQFGQADDIYYMAMVFVAGRDLRYILKDHAADGTHMAPADILRIVTDVADALDYAHQAGVIHRDVKPSNIMVMADGHAVLTDFGLVLNVPEGTIGTTFGSVHYIAPEQAESSRMAVPQSDLYALGVVLYEMLAGRVPFDDASVVNVALQQLNDAPPPPSLFNHDLTPAVEAMVLRALAKDPAQRYQSGASFVAALEGALGMTDDDEITRRLPLPLRPTVAVPPVPVRPLPAWTDGDSETPTLVDSDTDQQSTPALVREKFTVSLPTLPPPAPKQRRRVYAAGIALALVLVAVAGIGALLAATSGSSGPAQANSAADTSTPLVAALAGTPTATLTPVPPTASPTRATPTAAPTVTRLSAVADAATTTPADVRLIYDAQGLALLNISAAAVDVSGLTFTQPQADGTALTFRSSMWSRGSAPPEALPPGDCFQVWTVDEVQLQPPSVCGTRHAWSRVSPLRRFWASDTPGAMFSVARGDTPLAECPVGTGECAFTLN